MNKIELQDGKYLYYDKGRFDDWCIYEVFDNGKKSAPKDIDYLNELNKYTKIFDRNKIYQDFVQIYNLTNNQLELSIILEIKNISNTYANYSKDFFRIFAIIYMGMVAEENKKNTKLGKRIKRLGIYYLLVKEKSPSYCANFMKEKNWKEIDKICLEGNF